MPSRMSAEVIISYDGTANDDDALALGAIFARAGVSLALAYVRHAPEIDAEREKLAQHDAEGRLDQGATLLGQPDIPRHVVMSGSTGAGLEELAESHGASLIVFGSDYRTPPGHAEPPASAQRLLEIGTVALAVAADGLRALPDAAIASVTVLPADNAAARETADALAQKLGAQVLDPGPGAANADLIVVGSQPGVPGRLALSGAARTALDASRGSVLVLPGDTPLHL